MLDQGYCSYLGKDYEPEWGQKVNWENSGTRVHFVYPDWDCGELWMDTCAYLPECPDEIDWTEYNDFWFYEAVPDPNCP